MDEPQQPRPDDPTATPVEPLPRDPPRETSPVRRGRITRVTAAQWSGPLPPPAMLRGYEDVEPGVTKVLLDQMVREGRCRRRLERERVLADVRDIRADRKERRFGQKLAAATAALAIVAGSTVAALGHEKTGVAIGAGITIGVVTVFVTGKAMLANDEPAIDRQKRRRTRTPERVESSGPMPPDA